jgi:glycosyltransferase involved in cell wall biosynthesis
MNIDDITLVTCTYNQTDAVKPCFKSIFKALGRTLPVVVINNGNDIWFPEDYVDTATVINNTGHRLLSEEEFPQRCKRHPSDCHSAALSWALNNAVHTKYAMLTDTDVIYYPTLKELLETVGNHDLIGKIGHLKEDAPGRWRSRDRVYPHFCVINVDRMKKDGISFFDKDRCASCKPCRGDTGYSFREDIQSHGWDIHIIHLADYCTHLKGASWDKRKNYRKWYNSLKGYWA